MSSDHVDKKRRFETDANKKIARDSSSSVPIGDRRLDDPATPEWRYLSYFLNWSTSDYSVAPGADFANCVHQVLSPDLAVAYLKKYYPELHRDPHFEHMLHEFERKITNIESKYLSDQPGPDERSKAVSKLCDAYHEIFGDREYADDDQAREVTRLLRDSVAYQQMDESLAKLLDGVFPEILSDDDDDDGGDAEEAPYQSVAQFVARHLQDHTGDSLMVRDVIGSRDESDGVSVNYLESYEKFLHEQLLSSKRIG